MGSLVRYDFDGSVARITMDDGKVNVLSQEMLAELNEALGRGGRGDCCAGWAGGGVLRRIRPKGIARGRT
jgi:enoyl-CoA hydratase/carnithine racemase